MFGLYYLKTGDKPPITELASYTLYQTPIDNQATAYICRNFACDSPTTDVKRLTNALSGK